MLRLAQLKFHLAVSYRVLIYLPSMGSLRVNAIRASKLEGARVLSFRKNAER
jgi:hypothetical protein